MIVKVFDNKEMMGHAAAEAGAKMIRNAINERGEARIILATGTSQFATLQNVVTSPNIDWGRVTVFHLDEYIGLPVTHPASFRKYIKERFIGKLPKPLRDFHMIDGEADPASECARLAALINAAPIDMAFVGIGENGHLAFNDPPADFNTEEPYIVVNLDEACRRQQFGEGWFATLDEVPKRAISMSIKQILKSRGIICAVPDERKADAVAGAVEGRVTPDVPASILQTHPDCAIYLDRDAAAKLKRQNC